ncbi:MAG: transcriptional regulator [Myxococcales bacterium]|nr:transcriptional regulator [Myxococcales bacterium]MCB9577382.1 transcriptional regulator [Polyangiaceae bacterium]
MSRNRAYRSFADFEREEIRPGLRIGWSVDELEEPSRNELDFDVDPWEAALDSAEYEDDDDSDDE